MPLHLHHPDTVTINMDLAAEGERLARTFGRDLAAEGERLARTFGRDLATEGGRLAQTFGCREPEIYVVRCNGKWAWDVFYGNPAFDTVGVEETHGAALRAALTAASK